MLTLTTLAVLAIICKSILVALSVADIAQVKKDKLNGPIQFMTFDNLRHQVSLLIVVFLIYADVEVWAFVVVLLDALFAFRRRHRMAILVGEYLAMSMPGGRRSTDRCRS